MGKLSDAKLLGGIGSILQIIPGINIVGYVLVLIATKFISDELADKTIFDNMLYAIIAAIVGAAAGVFLFFTGVIFGVFTLGISAIGGILGALVVVWIALIFSSIFIRRAFDTMATRLNVGTFRTAGLLYFIGAILAIILVGFIILFIAFIIQIIAFFSIPETMAPAPGQPSPGAPPAAQVGMKFCPNCGTQMPMATAFCPKCGTKQF